MVEGLQFPAVDLLAIIGDKYYNVCNNGLMVNMYYGQAVW